MAKPRVVVLGIDAANPHLLRRWADDGTLPNLAALMSKGLSGAIRGLDGFFISATWPSLYTGVGPGRHGFHYQRQLRPGTYQLYEVGGGEALHAPPVWRHLSEAGKRVAVLDVPLSHPEPQLNGIQLIEWGVHDELYGFHSHPKSLGGEVLHKHGSHPIGAHCDGIRASSADYRSFTDQLVEGVRSKAILTRCLLAREPWDFLIQVFSEAHCVGHQCWHLHDVEHPAYDPKLAAATGDPIKCIYRALDSAIGEIVADCGDAVVMLISAHGMSRWYGAQFLLREILFKLGVAVRETPSPPSRTPRSMRMRDVLSAGWRRLPSSVRTRLRPLRNSLAEDAVGSPSTIGVDTSSSACFVLDNGMGTGGIRLNVVGREPHGVLRPGVDVDSFVKRLSRSLLAIIDANSDRPLIARVLRTAALYEGTYVDHLPDLIVEWNSDISVGCAQVSEGRGAHITAKSEEIGVVEGVNRYCRTGEHRPEGMFIAAGPNIAPAVLPRAVSVLDFVPTFCELLRVSKLRSDGSVICEIAQSSPW